MTVRLGLIILMYKQLPELSTLKHIQHRPEKHQYKKQNHLLLTVKLILELDTKYLLIVAMNVVNNMSKQTYDLSLSVLSMMLQLRKLFYKPLVIT